MRFEYRYYGTSRVEDGVAATDLCFVPDTLRRPTYFVAEIAHHLPFREGMSALHDVVIADQRFKGKDRTTYFAWLRENESSLLAEFMARGRSLKAQLGPLQQQLNSLYHRKQALIEPFYRAQRKYFDYLYRHNRDLWYAFDPVITVHPDRVFFECFSVDESSYASLSCSHNVFRHLGEFACGTTNIDYSAGLYQEFQKIRDYKATRLTIEPTGFQVQTGSDDGFTEAKIDLPDSWLRGFLQVSSAMNLPARQVVLHPMDVHNLCFALAQRRERVGPRSLCFVLRAGQPVVIRVEPWDLDIRCPRSIYQGPDDDIRIWGRRRLQVLQRLIPVADRFVVHLAGSGLPSFWVAEMAGGDLQFCLGLSGWIANDWARAGHFDLLSPRRNVDALTQGLVFRALERRWFATAATLAQDTNLDPPTVAAALALYVQHGRAIYDLADGVYRLRELAREPLPFDQLRFASPQEATAAHLLALGKVRRKQAQTNALGVQLQAEIGDGDRRYAVMAQLDSDERIIVATCQCDHFVRNRLRRGPCAHILALSQMHGAAASA